jgi:hypothetical protein
MVIRLVVVKPGIARQQCVEDLLLVDARGARCGDRAAQLPIGVALRALAQPRIVVGGRVAGVVDPGSVGCCLSDGSPHVANVVSVRRHGRMIMAVADESRPLPGRGLGNSVSQGGSCSDGSIAIGRSGGKFAV